MRWTVSIGLVLFGSCYLLEGTPVYYSDPIRIRVADEETEQPVVGAVAFAWWEGQGLGEHRYLHVAEAVSDQNGWLTLPGFRILRTPFFTMNNQDPMIKLYKPGAYDGTADNNGAHQFGYQSADPWRIHRVAFWNGRTIPLRALKTTAQQVGAWQSLHFRFDYRRQDTTRLPRTWRALVDGYHNLPTAQRKELIDPVEWLKVVNTLEQ